MARPFTVTVDSGDDDEPSPHHYATFDSARRAFCRLEPRWQRFAWITEKHVDASGGVIVHMRDGRMVQR